MKKKSKYKKLGDQFKKGFKETADFVKREGPKAHAYFRRTSSTTMDILRPQRRRTFVDLTAKKKPSRVVRGKGGFYLDFT